MRIGRISFGNYGTPETAEEMQARTLKAIQGSQRHADAQVEQDRAIDQVNAIRNAEVAMLRSQVSTLQQQLRALEEANRAFAKQQADWAADRNHAVGRQVYWETRAEALEGYAQHKPGCDSHKTYVLKFSDPLTERRLPCTCGLSALLAPPQDDQP